MTTLRAHLLAGFGEDEVALLREALDPRVGLTCGEDPPDELLARVDVLITGHVTPELLDRAPRARAVIIPYAGPPLATLETMAARPGVTLHNLHHNAQATAEMAMALLLAAAKNIVPRHKEFEQKGWPARLWAESDAILLEGRVALVAGHGNIGRRIARALQGFGMDVQGLRRSCDQPHDDAAGVHVFGPALLRERLALTNVLVVALPGTPGTLGMFGAEELALLRAPSIVVNVGRGPVIDDKALYEALRDRRITCAGLDVWWTYPAGALDEATGQRGSDHPFHELPNVAMSPHRGGLSDLDAGMRMQDLARLLNAAANGEPIPNRVDPTIGY